MGSVSSDQEWLDEVSERFDLESYCLSADVSESETFCSSPYTTTNTLHRGGASTSSSPFGGAAFSGQIPVMLPPVVGGRHVIIPLGMAATPQTDLDEVELMKERFAKLLLGEDMSGGGKGVCTALAISNAITNLSASVFGQLCVSPRGYSL